MSEPDIASMAGVWKIFGRRWTLAILQTLGAAEPYRFTQLKRSLRGISGTMLSERLSELESEGLVAKKVYCSVPPKVEYRLTPSASELLLIIRNIYAWRARWTLGKDMYEIMKLAAR